MLAVTEKGSWQEGANKQTPQYSTISALQYKIMCHLEVCKQSGRGELIRGIDRRSQVFYWWNDIRSYALVDTCPFVGVTSVICLYDLTQKIQGCDSHLTTSALAAQLPACRHILNRCLWYADNLLQESSYLQSNEEGCMKFQSQSSIICHQGWHGCQVKSSLRYSNWLGI